MTPGERHAVAAALDRRLDRESAAPVVVALSGGSDSLALTLIAGAWARLHGRPLLALTIDHRLQDASALWTARAGAAARRLGADWRALAWEGAKPATGLAAAARRARHALLAEGARQAGACVVLMGHTADDVAESALIRRDTPSHGRLTEWAPSPVWPQGRGVFVLRPLLGVGREALRALLRARGIDWLEDPANADLRSARARARQALARYGTPPAERPARAWPPIGAWSSGTDGSVALAREAAGGELLARALLCAGGGGRPPAGRAVARLAERIAGEAAVCATLAGARLHAEGAAVRLTREPGRRAPKPQALAPGVTQVFDGRFELVAAEPGWRVALLAGRAASLPRGDRRSLAAVRADARAALPVLIGPDGSTRLPAPFGDGPAQARALVGLRLAAALGDVANEATLATPLGAESARRPHGAPFAPALSCSRDKGVQHATAGAASPTCGAGSEA